MNPYSDFPSQIEGIVRRRLRKGKYARRNELARRLLGSAIVGGVVGYYIGRFLSMIVFNA